MKDHVLKTLLSPDVLGQVAVIVIAAAVCFVVLAWYGSVEERKDDGKK